MGNLALTNSCNQLTISNIHKMSTCRLFEKFTATSRQRLGQPQNKEVSPKGRLERARAAARSPREDQALLLRRQLPLVPRAASPHRGNLVALSLSFIIEGRCLQAGQRHGPRRIAQHPEQSGPLPLPALTHQSPEIGKEKNKFSFSLGFHYICREWLFL